MCGFIGYVGREDALPILREGLSNLEYRGYDSAGIALGGQRLDVYKKEGELAALKAILPESSTATTAIGHTRWSTHSEPTDRNAHPHTDESGDVAVVHNGIIENYDALRTELDGRGEVRRPGVYGSGAGGTGAARGERVLPVVQLLRGESERAVDR